MIDIPEEVRFDLPQWIQLKSTEKSVYNTRNYTFSTQANIADTARTDTYERAMNVAFVQQKPFAYLTDWFDQVVPFWQLRLYMMDVCGKADFYKDVYEASIQAGHEKQLSSGEWQLEFVYNCCVAAKTDLRPFFSKWGYMTPTKRAG